MERDTTKKPMMLRRRRVPSQVNGSAKRPREFLYFQVHYQPRPGAKKSHLSAVQPKLIERLHDMIRRGYLIVSGSYPTSIGGMWLLRVKNRNEAERFVLDNPLVACNLVTYRLIELQDPIGVVVQQERDLIAEAAEKNPEKAAEKSEEKTEAKSE